MVKKKSKELLPAGSNFCISSFSILKLAYGNQEIQPRNPGNQI